MYQTTGKTLRDSMDGMGKHICNECMKSHSWSRIGFNGWVALIILSSVYVFVAWIYNVYLVIRYDVLCFDYNVEIKAYVLAIGNVPAFGIYVESLILMDFKIWLFCFF